MLKKSVEYLVNRVAEKLHFSIQKIPSDDAISDLLSDQQWLLSGTQVKTICDVGAHIGTVTSVYHTMFPESDIYCFEPTPDSFHHLHEKFSNEDNIHLVQTALSDKVGTEQFQLNSEGSTNSLLSVSKDIDKWVPNINYVDLVDTISVNVTTLDTYCSENTLMDIDILKLDVQGNELLVLEGSNDLLARQRIKLICAEISFVPLYTGQTSFTEIYDMLSKYGFLLHGLYEPRCAENGRVKWCDALFIHRSVIGD